MSQSLDAAVAHLFDTFARYGLADVVEGCPCCVTPEEQARLRARPLRQLTADDLGGFAFSALSTWGTLHDLKHFLPRILELVASGALLIDLQQVYGKLVQEGPWLPPSSRRWSSSRGRCSHDRSKAIGWLRSTWWRVRVSPAWT